MDSRRKFLKNSAMVGAALFASGTANLANAQDSRVQLPTPRALQLMSFFGLKYPIFQAPSNGAGPDLTASVSSAGAMGILRGTRLTPEDARKAVTIVRARTQRVFAVNYILAFEPDSLPAVLEAGAPALHFSWGLPTKEMISVMRSAGAKSGVQVASAIGAQSALDLGADYLVCQGIEAGGHVQSSTVLYELLPKVLERAQSTPVLAAGGIGHGRKIREALLAGASGAMLGTRFVATQENLAHPEYKSLLIKSTGSETTMSVCFQGRVAGRYASLAAQLDSGALGGGWLSAGWPTAGRR